MTWMHNYYIAFQSKRLDDKDEAQSKWTLELDSTAQKLFESS